MGKPKKKKRKSSKDINLPVDTSSCVIALPLITMKQLILSLGLLLVVLAVSCQKSADTTPVTPTPTPTPTTPAVPTYSFTDSTVWRDEFNYTGKPDPTRWGYDLGASGWGNNELENYTNNLNNARVENGKLIVEAQKTASSYTSARLVTKNKGDWKYGRVVVRAKLPSGRGTWPAIWMLATNQTYGSAYWPDNGEIDIMEHVGFDPNVIHASAHTKAYNFTINTQKTAITTLPTALTEFHDYALEWTPISMKMSIDNTVYFSYLPTSVQWQYWPFDQPFHLLLNLAIGGDWGGQKGVDDSIFPQQMQIDYVRVYGLVTK